MKVLAAYILFLPFAAAAWAEICSVQPPEEARAAFAEALRSSPAPKSPMKVAPIPLSINLIVDRRQGNYSDAVILTMLNNLNWGFRDTPFQFYIAKFRRVNNKKWFQNCMVGTGNHTAMTKKLALDPRRYVNVYICNLPGFLGWASIPNVFFPPGDKRDGVLINPQALPHGLFDERYSYYGLTAVHEVGHYLGLWHTFHGGCLDYDLVADTPPQDRPTEYCPTSIDTCPEPGNDDVWNFMNYAEDFCQDHFTPGQRELMVWAVQTFRSGLVR